MYKFLLFVLVLSVTPAAMAKSGAPDRSQDGIWQRVYEPAGDLMKGSSDWKSNPLLGQPVYQLQEQALRSALERSSAPGADAGTISLPMPNGGYENFMVLKTSVLSPELAARYPEISTYRLVSAERPGVLGQANLTPLGFSALVLSPEGSFQVAQDPHLKGGFYLSFLEKDLPAMELPVCHAEIDDGPVAAKGKDLTSRLMASGLGRSHLEISSGTELREYELAVATTDDYYTDNGGDDTSVLSNISDVISKVDLILEMEVAISLVLISETDDLFDIEYANSGNACDLKNENQGVVQGILADGDYDIGFVFDDRAVTSGGCASGSVVCDNGNKAEGSAGLQNNPDPDHEGFGGYRLVLHEMGHQFSAGHTWSGNSGNCTDDQYSENNAYEPGGGTTLMSYSGTCGTIGNDDIQSSTGDVYFHGRSFDQIVTFSTVGGGDACASTGNTGNQAPSVDAGSDFTIPADTPFTLSGSGNDPDSDPLVFTWEQFDLAADRFNLGVDDGVGPIIRSRIPGSDPVRTVPPWDDILNGTSSPGELLPQADRTLNFRLTARDGLPGGGGVDSDAMVITVAGDSFFVTAPNGGEDIKGGCPADVTWTVGGGDVAANVDLMLSDDGGASFQSLLLNTANDGTESFSEFSCTPTSQARVMAQASDNIFFDVSDANFAVVEDPPDVSLTVNGGEVDENCEFTLTFEADVTDDCSVDAADITVTIGQVGDVATIGTPTINKQQINDTTVEIDGSVLISDLSGSPAQIGVEIDAVDGCGFEGDGFELADVEDTTPPTIDVSLSPDVLWAPNHKMRNITATVEIEDNCDASPAVVLWSVESNEPENDLGDGNTEPDIEGADLVSEDYEFQLRAERQGGKDGRVYTVTYRTMDESENEAQAEATVTVPPDRKGKK